MLQLVLKMTDGESALRCAKNLQRPETERIQSHTHRLMQKKEMGPVIKIEIATIFDVHGIEVQVPSLSSLGYSVWILISRGHERFEIEIHRHNSDIVNYSSTLRMKENVNNVCSESSKHAVVNHGQGSEDSNNVKTQVEPSSVHRETVASTIRVSPASSKSSSRRLRQQSYVKTSKGKIHSRKERDPQGGQNLDYNSWMSRNAKEIHLRFAYPSVSRIWFDTMIKMNEKQMERGIGMVYFQY